MVRKMALRASRREKREKGQALVEFALSLPVVLIVLIGFVGMAYIFYSWVTLYHAANEGVSYAVRHPNAGEMEIIQNGIKPNMYALYDASNINVNKYPDRVTISIDYRIPLPTVRIPYVLTEGEVVLLQPLSVRVRSVGFYD